MIISYINFEGDKEDLLKSKLLSEVNDNINKSTEKEK